jgi:hypothetical protein
MVLDDLFHPAFLGTVFHPLLSVVADIKVTVPTKTDVGHFFVFIYFRK